MKTYCLRCHNARQQKGSFRLDNLSQDFSNQAVSQRWGEVLFRINAGEMPPKKEPRPRAKELGKVVDWVSARIKEGEAARMAKRGPVAHYRLSREEYGHTVLDLLGVYFDVSMPGAFHEDPRWHGFERIGSMLSLSPSHVDRYFRAAETIRRPGVPRLAAEATEGPPDADDGRSRKSRATSARSAGCSGRPRSALVNLASPAFTASAFSRRTALVQGARTPPRPVAPRTEAVARGAGCPGRRKTSRRSSRSRRSCRKELTTIRNESPGTFSDGHTLSNTEFTFRNTKTTRQNRPTGYKLFDDQGKPIYPTLIVDWVETEGPILPDADRKKREGLIPAKEGDLGEARECLKRLATRAWRRTATDVEIDRYVKIVQSELAAGENFRSAYRAAMVGILTSKNFYYLEEGSASEKRDKVNDWELASRLSYFLWGSMPDDELFAAARGRAQLRQPDVAAGSAEAHAGRRRRSADSPRPFRGNGCSCTGSACFRPTRSSIPTTTSGWRRAWCWRRRTTSTRCFRRTCARASSSPRTGRC